MLLFYLSLLVTFHHHTPTTSFPPSFLSILLFPTPSLPIPTRKSKSDSITVYYVQPTSGGWGVNHTLQFPLLRSSIAPASPRPSSPTDGGDLLYEDNATVGDLAAWLFRRISAEKTADTIALPTAVTIDDSNCSSSGGGSGGPSQLLRRSGAPSSPQQLLFTLVNYDAGKLRANFTIQSVFPHSFSVAAMIDRVGKRGGVNSVVYVYCLAPVEVCVAASPSPAAATAQSVPAAAPAAATAAGTASIAEEDEEMLDVTQPAAADLLPLLPLEASAAAMVAPADPSAAEAAASEAAEASWDAPWYFLEHLRQQRKPVSPPPITAAAAAPIAVGLGAGVGARASLPSPPSAAAPPSPRAGGGGGSSLNLKRKQPPASPSLLPLPFEPVPSPMMDDGEATSAAAAAPPPSLLPQQQQQQHPPLSQSVGRGGGPAPSDFAVLWVRSVTQQDLDFANLIGADPLVVPLKTVTGAPLTHRQLLGLVNDMMRLVLRDIKPREYTIGVLDLRTGRKAAARPPAASAAGARHVVVPSTAAAQPEAVAAASMAARHGDSVSLGDVLLGYSSIPVLSATTSLPCTDEPFSLLLWQQLCVDITGSEVPGDQKLTAGFFPSTVPEPPLPALTLEDCLRKFATREQLDEDDKYRCPTCKEEVRCGLHLHFAILTFA